MRTWEAVLSIVATVLGAGLVFIPHAVYKVGIPMGIIIQIVSASLSFFSCTLYMRAQKMVPFPVETLYDLGYIVMRSRVIVFCIAGLLLTSCTGCSIIYLILFGDTAASIMK
jgi:amino acid permease